MFRVVLRGGRTFQGESTILGGGGVGNNLYLCGIRIMDYNPISLRANYRNV
jgi:hypothetical protein